VPSCRLLTTTESFKTRDDRRRCRGTTEHANACPMGTCHAFLRLALGGMLLVQAAGCVRAIGGDADGNEGDGDESEGEGEGEALGEGEGEEPGEGEGEADPCPLADVCAGVVPSGSLTFGNGGVVDVAGAALAVGTTRRADVEVALGSGTPDAENPFRVTYCSRGVSVQYVDGDGTIEQAPSPTGSDVLARVLTLPGAAASAANGAQIGEPPPNATPTARVAVGAGEMLFFAPAGLSVLLDDAGDVVQLTAYRAQDRDIWTLPLVLRSDEQSLGGVARGATFAELADVLGDAPDATGVVTLSRGAGQVFVQVRIWASAGIRVAGLCDGGVCNESTEISSITVSPPFLGRDQALGIGSTRAEVDAAVGTTGSLDGNVVVYGEPDLFGFGDPALGVVFVQDTQCVERAAAFVMNYVSLD
jgi:hypothetical protein